MQADFLVRGWADGFPLVPPTERAVGALLRSTRRGPGDVIATLEPGFGIATVEKLAINAVMAGCGPEHLPLLIAAVRCLAEPKMYIRNKAMSTGPHAPLVLVNGPKGRAASLNSGMCALGPGAPSASNTVLGRAVRLTMMNVGHTYVGVSAMDTIGSPLKYSLCCAENEAASPWEPYHVTRGYAREASTVTVHFVYGICELHDFKSTTPEHLAEVFATAATNVAQVGTGLWLVGRRADPRYKTEEKEHNTLFICPEHAQIFAREGWGRARIQDALYKAARVPFRTLTLNKEPKAMAIAHPQLGWLADHPDLPLPVGVTPDGQLSRDLGIATAWEPSADHRRWTFTLRRGVRFHNGDELTSSDVKWSLLRAISKRSTTGYAGVLRALLQDIETPAPDRVVIVTKEPTLVIPPYLSRALSSEGMILPRKYVEAVGDDMFAQKPIGSGPYRFVEQVTGSHVKLTAVERHWRLGTPKYRIVTFRVVPEEATRMAMVRRGDVDVADV